MSIRYFTTLFLLAAPSYLFAQSSDGAAKVVLDDHFMVSARAAGLGGNLVGVADGVDAAYFNPAGIGGINWGPRVEKKGFLKKMSFPRVGVEANKNTQNLRKKILDTGNMETDLATGEALVNAASGERQYGRTSLAMDVQFGRAILIGYQDIQFAAIQNIEESAEAGGQIDLNYRSVSGVGYGYSASDSKKKFTLGVFSTYETRSDVKAESVSYTQIVTKEDRTTLISDNKQSWSGVSTHVGAMWVMAKKMRPTLGVSIRNLGQSKYKPKDEKTTEELIIPQKLNIGFSLSPKVGKEGLVNVMFETKGLSDHEMALKKKFGLGLEYTYGPFGSDSTFALRAGYTSAGASYGVGLNLGILKIEVASQAIDVGVGNANLPERRNLAIITVNPAD